MQKPQTKNEEKNQVIDLFCGVGGLSLGAARAGFKVVCGIDADKRALAAHEKNFPGSAHLNEDIKELTSQKLLSSLSLPKSEIEAIIGGPPCQGFSRIGRRDPNDPRNSLFYHFLRFVSEIQPPFFLLENVPGILDECFDELRARAFSQVSTYKIIGPIVLKASDFGAATSRERVFYVGYLPQYYSNILPSDFTPDSKISPINVKLALQGLRKSINPNWQDEEDGWRALTLKPEGWFWEKMFAELPAGVGNAEAIDSLNKYNLVSGCLGTAHTAEVVKRFSILPEGSIDKHSRALRLKRTGLCPTLRAGTGVDHGSFQALRPIHPTEPRVITPREAARLQGFPDWFQFDSTKWHSFRQIGNSVSPILAEAVLKRILTKKKVQGASYAKAG